MNYPPISDTTQLQILESMARMLLHGVLAAIAVATVIVLCLCLAELLLSGRQTAEVEGGSWQPCASPARAARHGQSLYSLTPVRLWDIEVEQASQAPGLKSGSVRDETHLRGLSPA